MTLYRFVCFFLRLFFAIFYRVEVSNPPKLKGGVLILSNHVSFYDPPLIGLSLKEEIYYLARSSLFRFYPFKLILKLLHAIPIEKGIASHDVLRFLQKLLEQGQSVLIFPEGRRSPDGRLAPLREGALILALATQADIYPVYIEGAYEAWPKTKLFPRLFKTIRIRYGPVIHSSKYQGLAKKEARKALLEELKLALEELICPPS